MNDTIYTACKELIDDARSRCADLVFKDICIEILSRAKNILTHEQLQQLTQYAEEKMKEKSLTETTIPL
jgi:hypothetical protein